MKALICRNLYRICTKISDDTSTKEEYIMNMDERIKRINELYHKSQSEGLTDEEKLEQSILRQEYVDSIKRNMKAQLDSIEIERPDGTIEKLKPSYKRRNEH